MSTVRQRRQRRSRGEQLCKVLLYAAWQQYGWLSHDKGQVRQVDKD